MEEELEDDDEEEDTWPRKHREKQTPKRRRRTKPYEEGAMPEITNVSVRSRWLAHFPLWAIGDALKRHGDNVRYVHYDPSQQRLHLASESPKATAQVFIKGKIVVTGTKSEEEAKQATNVFVSAIWETQEASFGDHEVFEYEVFLVTAAIDVGFKIDLEKFHRNNKHYTQYLPESAPQAYYRGFSTDVTATISTSGRVVFFAYKKNASKTKIDNAYQHLLPRLKKCKA